jgi:hypothetical protein
MRVALHLISWSLLLTALWVSGCRKKPDSFVEEGSLDFSTDTIFFDTMFVNLPSPTERVTVVNNSGNNVLIREIRLESGAEFDMVINAQQGDTIRDFELPDGDSLVAFVSFKSSQRDVFVRDRLLFTIGDQTQDVDIEAYVFDAVYYRDTTLGLDGNTTTYLDPDKRHLIDGYMYVPDGHTLFIPAGTQLFFTPRKDADFNLTSGIYVFGRLLVTGELGKEVVFQGSRFGRRYEETPGQWRGLSFGNLARASSISHAVIKNALIGVYQEYGNPGFGPKITIDKSEIRNMGAYGIASAGFTPENYLYPVLRVQNSLIHNCGEGTLAIFGGGKFDFIHSTFANYTLNFTRNSPQVYINNYDADALVPYACRATFSNCIIWGSEEDEVVPDSFPAQGIWDVTFHNSLVRTQEPLKGSNIISSQNQDFPRFVSPLESAPFERDYRLRENSPAVNIGQRIPGYDVDKEGLPRDVQPDAGCHEWRP